MTIFDFSLFFIFATLCFWVPGSQIPCNGPVYTVKKPVIIDWFP